MRTVLRANYSRWVMGGFFLLTTSLEIPTISDPGKGGTGLQIFAVAFVAVLAISAIRAFRSATVIATKTGVAYRSLFRTRHFNWTDVEHFEARDGQVGVMAYRRRILWVVLRDGQERKLEELNSRRAADDATSRVDAIAAELNAFGEKVVAA